MPPFEPAQPESADRLGKPTVTPVSPSLAVALRRKEPEPLERKKRVFEPAS